MEGIQKPRIGRHRSVFHSPAAIVIYFIAIVYLAFLVVRIAGKSREAGENRRIAEAELAELAARRESLAADIERLETDDGLEEAIREKFRVVKEGEGIVVIIDEPEDDAGTKKEGGGFWKFVKGIFGGR